MKVLIILVYCERPLMVRNALRSLKKSTYKDWELAFVDDGIYYPGKPIVLEELAGIPNTIKFYESGHTEEQKIRQGGSMHGSFMNRAVQESDADLVVVLCDDDALTENGLEQLVQYYKSHPTVMYSYSFVIEYDPSVGSPWDQELKYSSWYNRTKQDIAPSCQVDSSQVTFRTCVFKDGIRYPFPMTAALDADIFVQLTAKYGLCPYNGVTLQYKGVFFDQMGKRKDPFGPTIR